MFSCPAYDFALVNDVSPDTTESEFRHSFTIVQPPCCPLSELS